MNRLYGANAIEINQDLQAIYGYIPPLRRMSPRTRSRRHMQPLQHPTITSSTPAIFEDEIYGPILMQRLDGFLIVVHPTTRIIQHVASNIERHTQYTVDEMKGKMIDRFLHPSNIQDFVTTRDLVMMSGGRDKPRVNLKMKIGFEQHEFVEMVFDLVKHDGEMSVVCSVERMGRNMLLRDPTIQEFSTKIRLDGTICSIEVSGVDQHYWAHLNETLRGRKVQDLCFGGDGATFKKFITDVVVVQKAELREITWVLEENFSVSLSTVAKFFKKNPMFSLSVDFIMCVHTIIG